MVPTGMHVRRQMTLPVQTRAPIQNVPKPSVLQRAAALTVLAPKADDQQFFLRFKAMVAAAESLEVLQV